MARKRCVLRWGAAVGLYWAACAAHVWRTGGLLALGLAWNMLLALLPLCFACAAGRCRLWAGRAALAVLWLLFLPNTFYMLTDLIHTPQNMEWVNAADWTVRHSENVSDWLLTLLLGTGAVLAVLLGLEAMRVFGVYCCAHWPRPAVWACGGTVLLLCGFGMYIGRFFAAEQLGYIASAGAAAARLGFNGRVSAASDPAVCRSGFFAVACIWCAAACGRGEAGE